MNINMQEYLERADAFLVGKNKVMVIALFFIVILAVCIMVILPLCEDIKNAADDSLSQTRQQFNAKADPAELRVTIARQEREIAANRLIISERETEAKIFVDRINKFADDFFGRGDVNTYINTMAQKAALNNVGVIVIDNNTKAVAHKQLEPIYDINLTFKAAKFDPLIKYLYDLEATNELSDIKYLDVSALSGELSGILNIITWGFKK